MKKLVFMFVALQLSLSHHVVTKLRLLRLTPIL